MILDDTATEHARSIALQFALREPLEVLDFPGKGNINRQTYLIASGPPDNRGHHLLQLLNPDVFTEPVAVMEAAISCIRAQQQALREGVVDDKEWETIELIPTREGADYLKIADGQGIRCWRMMQRIGPARSYRSLREIAGRVERLRIAEEAGRGLALFGRLTASMDPNAISCPLPGYRDTSLYYRQLASVLAGSRTEEEAAPFLPDDEMVRRSAGRHFLIHADEQESRRRLNEPDVQRLIDLALAQEPRALTLINRLRSGELRKVVVHGDTKLDNFLFSADTGRVRSLVDLDTIMPHTWLSDWGDMVRSLVNPAGERERDHEKIEIDMAVFEALARGFLGATRGIESEEIELMVDAPQIMALELGVRFLTDYLRGDSYFTRGDDDPPDLNKTRALVQFRVFERLCSSEEPARSIVEALRTRS